MADSNKTTTTTTARALSILPYGPCDGEGGGCASVGRNIEEGQGQRTCCGMALCARPAVVQKVPMLYLPPLLIHAAHAMHALEPLVLVLVFSLGAFQKVRVA